MQFRQMSCRRLGLLALLGVGVVVISLPISSPAQSVSRKLTDKEMPVHVLNRLAFGPRPGQVQEVQKMGWKNWVEEQLYPEKLKWPELEERLKKRSPSLWASMETLENLRKGKKKNDKDLKADMLRIKNELREAVLTRAVFSRAQLEEVVAEFWRNHFNVHVDKVPFLATHYEENAIRPHLFGKFEDMLMATAKHPCMQIYLDNFVSVKRGLNENYARELMELHTLGVDNYYNQDDVVALARVLTGWTCGWKSNKFQFFFDPTVHDTTPVKILNKKILGKGGIKDGEDIIRHLANHDGTARFITTKLCRYFVNDFPTQDIISDVSDVFSKTKGDLREVYKAIFFHPDFQSFRNYRAKFKTPFEYTVSVLRVTRANFTNPDQIFKDLRLMGQPIYDQEEPTGYSDQQEAWLDPGIMVYRWNFALSLVSNKLAGVKVGDGFVQEVAKTPANLRAKKVMDICLPGVVDAKTSFLISKTTDPQAMVAWALGSASFQQQ